MSLGGEGVQILDISKGRDVTPLTLRTLEDVTSVGFAPDNRHLAILFDGTFGIWRMKNFQEVGRLRGPNRIASFSFASSSDYVIAARTDDTIQLFNIRTRQARSVASSHNIRVVAVNADATLVASADEYGLLSIFDVSTGEEIASLQHEGDINNIVFSDDGKYLATSTNANTFRSTYEENLLHVWLLRPKDLINEACRRLVGFPKIDLANCATR